MSESVWNRLEFNLRDRTGPEESSKSEIVRLEERWKARQKALSARAHNSSQADHVDIMNFQIAGEKYGIHLPDAVSVHVMTSITPVPEAPAYVHGICQVRGEIICLVDLGILLGLKREGLQDIRRAIVIGNSAQRVGLMAGEVEGIEIIEKSQIAPPPPGFANLEKECVWGVFGRDRLLISTKGVLGSFTAGGRS